MSTGNRHSPATSTPGEIVRTTRLAQGLTLAQLGALTGYSAAQVSRYERGITPLTDIGVLRAFADALRLPPAALGLAATTAPVVRRPRARRGDVARPTGLPASIVTGGPRHHSEEDPVRRRQLLSGLAVTAAATTGARLPGATEQAPLGDVMVARLRDAMLGIGSASVIPPGHLRTELDRATADFDACRYAQLGVRLPRLITSGHAYLPDAQQPTDHAALAEVYLLATRLLIKLDEQELGWMAADRARSLADSGDRVLTRGEASRTLAVLARRAGWHREAMTIALAAADDADLRRTGAAGEAERGLLIQSAAYTAARAGDQRGMRELTDEAAALARRMRGPLLRAHGGGFSSATVTLHRISAENSLGDPTAALAAARTVAPAALPTVERRARYYTDLATAFGQLGRREECVRALLGAEHHAPEETHARPAVRALLSGLLISGRTTPDLRGLAARCGIR
ncbi:helix-turn-helix domain-containing protein [Streptomyces radicis]|uniref:XRE family transcriptional regulator n=1 Tax=Streptomyces radicis TaxID=1750517 RepID=A0A3A9W7C7_9ACTN|nr:helix-turn-helix transcriptional regulator [Streptomyces radicis]RKN05194.1 XRE family transcriptional regulator [Streptomyces radicis]RKN16727.1 XRE family transcriptional regulator [Streptomyces radicis]